MAITRITTWADGNVLTAAALNGEFDNIINNANGLISPLTTSLNFNNNQATNFRLQNAAADPGTLLSGGLFYHTAFNLVAADIGPVTLFLGPTGSVSRVRGLTGSLISNIGSFAAQEYQMTLKSFSTGLGTDRIGLAVTATSSYSVNTQTSGPAANGRDQAAAFGSGEVHFYAISTGLLSTTVAGMVSTVPPPRGPTTPSAYPYWSYLCSAPYSTASSALTDGAGSGWWIRGSKVWTRDGGVATNTASVVGAATVVNLSTFVPPTATDFTIGIEQFRGMAASTGSNVNVRLGLRAETGSGGSPDIQTLQMFQTSPGAGEYSAGTAYSATLPNLGTTGGKFEYLQTVVVGTSANFDWHPVSYTVPNGDN